MQKPTDNADQIKSSFTMPDKINLARCFSPLICSILVEQINVINLIAQ
jgi:hypothetical protein